MGIAWWRASIETTPAVEEEETPKKAKADHADRVSLLGSSAETLALQTLVAEQQHSIQSFTTVAAQAARDVAELASIIRSKAGMGR